MTRCGRLSALEKLVKRPLLDDTSAPDSFFIHAPPLFAAGPAGAFGRRHDAAADHLCRLHHLHQLSAGPTRSEERVVQVTRGTRDAVEREMQGVLAGMTVLANSRSLAATIRGLPRQRRSLRAAVSRKCRYFGRRREGTTFIQFGRPGGTNTCRHASRRPERDLVYQTGKPTFSALFSWGGHGHANPHHHCAGVSRRQGHLRPFIQSTARAFPAHHRAAAAERGMDGLDLRPGRHKFRAAAQPESTIGKRASPTLYAVMFSAPQGRAADHLARRCAAHHRLCALAS